MVSATIRRNLPYIVVAVIIIVIMADFVISYEPLQGFSANIQYSVGVIMNFAVVVGVIAQLLYHTKNISSRRTGWQYSVISWVLFMIFIVVAAATLNVGGTSSALYQFFFQGIELPAWWATHGFLVFYYMSACFRGFRARSYEGALMVSLTVVAFLGAAPATRALFESTLGFAYDWLNQVLATGVTRATIIVTFLGAFAFFVRVVIGKERVLGRS